MRVLLITGEFPPGPGGIGTHAYQVASGLNGAGWSVRVLASNDYVEPARAEAFNRDLPYEVVTFRASARGVWALPSRLRSILEQRKEWNPDLVLVTGDRLVHAFALIGGRTKWVAVEHGRLPPRWERPIKRWSLARATAVVYVSRFTRRRLEEMGVRPKRGEVITNGADPGVFHPVPLEEAQAVRSALGLPPARRLLVTVGHVSWRKGQDLVIRALPHLGAALREVTYVCVGLPTQEEEFAQLAERMGVREHVHFAGVLENRQLVQLLNAADIFIMFSRHTATQFEGYGIAAVEAALCGTPAVVARQSGLEEAVIDGTTGICVDREDVQGLAKAILRLLQDDEERERLGKEALARALREQTVDKVVERFIRLLASLT